jgi:hypothetical protein
MSQAAPDVRRQAEESRKLAAALMRDLRITVTEVIHEIRKRGGSATGLRGERLSRYTTTNSVSLEPTGIRVEGVGAVVIGGDTTVLPDGRVSTQVRVERAAEPRVPRLADLSIREPDGVTISHALLDGLRGTVSVEPSGDAWPARRPTPGISPVEPEACREIVIHLLAAGLGLELPGV